MPNFPRRLAHQLRAAGLETAHTLDLPEGNRNDLMLNETIETSGHTTKDGILNLSIKVGAADADVAVMVQVRASASSPVFAALYSLALSEIGPRSALNGCPVLRY